MWRRRISSMSWSMVSSRGSTVRAPARSPAAKLAKAALRMSLRAAVSTCTSASADSENRRPLSWSSRAESWMFRAWSPMRSKSPMAWSRRETVRMSAMDTPCWDTSTR